MPAITTSRKVTPSRNSDEYGLTGSRLVATGRKPPKSTKKQAKAEQLKRKHFWHDGGPKKKNSISLFSPTDRTVPAFGGCVGVKVEIVRRITGIVEFTKFFNGCVINNDGDLCSFSILDNFDAKIYCFEMTPASVPNSKDLQKVVQWRWAVAEENDLLMQKESKEKKRSSLGIVDTLVKTSTKLAFLAAAMKSHKAIKRISQRRSGFRATQIPRNSRITPEQLLSHNPETLRRTSSMTFKEVLHDTGDIECSDDDDAFVDSYDVRSRTASMEAWNLEIPNLEIPRLTERDSRVKQTLVCSASEHVDDRDDVLAYVGSDASSEADASERTNEASVRAALHTGSDYTPL